MVRVRNKKGRKRDVAEKSKTRMIKSEELGEEVTSGRGLANYKVVPTTQEQRNDICETPVSATGETRASPGGQHFTTATSNSVILKSTLPQSPSSISQMNRQTASSFPTNGNSPDCSLHKIGLVPVTCTCGVRPACTTVTSSSTTVSDAAPKRPHQTCDSTDSFPKSTPTAATTPGTSVGIPENPSSSCAGALSYLSQGPLNSNAFNTKLSHPVFPMTAVEPNISNTIPQWMFRDPLFFASGLASLWTLAAQSICPVPTPVDANRQGPSPSGGLSFQELLAGMQTQHVSSTNTIVNKTPERPSVTRMEASPLAQGTIAQGFNRSVIEPSRSKPEAVFSEPVSGVSNVLGTSCRAAACGTSFYPSESNEQILQCMNVTMPYSQDNSDDDKEISFKSTAGESLVDLLQRESPKSLEAQESSVGAKDERSDISPTDLLKKTTSSVKKRKRSCDGYRKSRKRGRHHSSSSSGSANRSVSVDPVLGVAGSLKSIGHGSTKLPDGLRKSTLRSSDVKKDCSTSEQQCTNEEDKMPTNNDGEENNLLDAIHASNKDKLYEKSKLGPLESTAVKSVNQIKFDEIVKVTGNMVDSEESSSDNIPFSPTLKGNRELLQLLDSKTLVKYNTIRQCPPKTELFQYPVSKSTPRKKKSKEENETASPKVIALKDEQELNTEEVANLGEIVWAKFGRQCWWPGIVTKGIYCGLNPARSGYCWVFWFGDHKVSEVSICNLKGFTEEYRRFKSSSHRSKLFGRALLEAIRECAVRSGHIECVDDSDVLFHWADDGFPVDDRVHHELFVANPSVPISSHLRELMSALADRMTEESDEIQLQRIENKHRRDDAFEKVRRNEIDISEVCISCDVHTDPVVAQHPLFYGGLCAECKQELMDTLFTYGDDGLNLYCVVCGNSGEMFVCDKPQCTRVYCVGCIDALVGEQFVSKFRKMDPWMCFMCTDYDRANHRLLRCKEDWQTNLIQFYQPEHVIQLPTGEFTKRPIRVLSLFDGISTGRHVLEKLSIDVEVYYSCEIDDDALQVSKVRYPENQCLGDITLIDRSKLKEIGPIDLVLGASPCNDLSLANPLRKGIFGGSGLLFFEFYRVLTEVQLLNQDHHVFWLFENVKTMMSEAKTTISRFLKCEPANWDAKMFSAQKRARYFWGNVPGMYCPPELSQMQQSMTLENVLTKDCNRTANVNKLRTVTTRPNSLKQGKNDELFPVKMNGQDNALWIQELERVFGFPDHYTDVGNMSPGKRQRLLGKAWSVPVVKHLLLPLKQFFVTRAKND